MPSTHTVPHRRAPDAARPQRGAAGAGCVEAVAGSGVRLPALILQLCATVRRLGEGGSLWPRTGNRALVCCGGEPGCDK